MTSWLVIFRAFLFIFFRPPDPKSKKKNSVNQLIKKFWPKSDTITVRFPQIHQTYKISRCLFSVYNPRTRTNIAEREQFPLALRFALTMHKAQGMTLEAVVVHCKGIFQAGQMPVGIGRVRSSKGLRLEGYRAGLCTQHRSYVTEYYRMPSKNL